jgi:ubiquinone/menaquinone biosynthesis C-methylase UbiE
MSDTTPFNPAASPEATTIWNDVVAPKYAQYERIMVDSASLHSDLIWDRFPIDRGDHVVDVGCGFGDTSRRLARHAARVTAIDCSEPLLRQALASYHDVENLEFVLADVGRYEPSAPVQACFSRFGLMFFERPVQTLKHLRSWLSPGATFGTLVWRSRRDNPWLDLAHRTVLEELPPVEEDAPNCGPGPFSMADSEMLTAQLKAAGFHSVTVEAIDAEVSVGQSVQEAVDFQFALGPAGEVVRHAQERGVPGVERVRERLWQVFSQLEGPNGISLPSASWWVTARA